MLLNQLVLKLGTSTSCPNMSKVQEAGSILRIGFALLKWPHLHRVYLVTVPFILILAVYAYKKPQIIIKCLTLKANSSLSFKALMMRKIL